MEHGATFWLSGECESWSLKVQRHWPSSTGQFIQCFTLCAFLCILHSFAKFLERHFTAQRQEDHEYSDESRSEGLTCEGEVPHVTRSCTPSFAGSYWIEHARQRWGLRYLQLTGFVPKLQIWSCFRHTWLPRCKNQTHKQVALWVWEVNNMKGFQWFSHILSPKLAWIPNLFIYISYIHSSFYGFYVFTYSHSPCVTHIWPWSFPVLQSMTKLTSLSHNLPISRRSTFHQHVPCLAMPNRTRACSCSWKLCAAEQPCLESSWCNCSDFKRQVYWVDCFVMFCCFVEAVLASFFLMFLVWNPKIPINLPVQQDYYAKCHEGIALRLQIATGRPKSQFPSRRLQPREREHQYDWNILKYWICSFIQAVQQFNVHTFLQKQELNCKCSLWILWYLSYILNSIQGSSNIMNIQQFNIRNLDIISEYITPPPGPKVGRCLSCTRWIAIHKHQDVASKYLYISMEKRNV